MDMISTISLVHELDGPKRSIEKAFHPDTEALEEGKIEQEPSRIVDDREGSKTRVEKLGGTSEKDDTKCEDDIEYPHSFRLVLATLGIPSAGVTAATCMKQLYTAAADSSLPTLIKVW